MDFGNRLQFIDQGMNKQLGHLPNKTPYNSDTWDGCGLHLDSMLILISEAPCASRSEFLLSPMIPSVAARSGGIALPLVRSLSEACGSNPKDGTERKLGAYLMTTCFHTSAISSAMFLTANHPNPLSAELAFATTNKVGNICSSFSIMVGFSVCDFSVLCASLTKWLPRPL